MATTGIKIFFSSILFAFVLMDLYLMANNIVLRYRISESDTDSSVDQSDDLENIHALFTVNDTYLNCGTQIGNISISDVKSHKTYDIRQVLDSVSDGNIVMVCRFNQYDCEKCISYAIERAYAFSEENDITLCVWGWYNDDNVIKVLMKRLGLYDKVHCYNVQELPVTIEQHGNPYCFVLTREGIMLDFYTPDKMDPVSNDRYFNNIGMKWEKMGYKIF